MADYFEVYTERSTFRHSLPPLFGFMDEILDGRIATGDEATGINVIIRAMASEEAGFDDVSDDEGPQVVSTLLLIPPLATTAVRDGRTMIAAGKKRRINEREEARVVRAAEDTSRARMNLEARKRSASNKLAADAKKLKKREDAEAATKEADENKDRDFVLAIRDTIKEFRDDIRSLQAPIAIATDPLSRAMALLNRDFAKLLSS
jgi:hypothetical protein